MFRKFTACAAALTLAFTPSVLANAEEKAMKISVNGQVISLPFNDTAGNEDERQILGDAWYYGIVAGTFRFNGESETNFAVKSLVHQNGAGGQTGVTDKGQGSKKAFFMAGYVDNPFMIKGIDAEVITPESEKEKFQNSCNTGNLIQFTDEDAEDINTYVDAMEDAVETQSQRLASLDSIIDYSELQNNGKITLDVTQAGNNTVYLNVDKWPGLISQFRQSSGVNLVKNADQKVVFDFPTDKSVNLQKMTVSVNGTAEDTAGLANHSTTSGSSTAADLIFNMPVAESVTLNDSAGIFLAPQAEVTSYGVDGGWLVADTFTNNCEWHFINGSLPEEITERKTVITPKHEGSVSGAKRTKPSVTLQTEEKPSATPEATVTPSSAPETTPAPTTTPSSSKTQENPSETPVTTPVPTPSVTTETTPAPSVRPQTEEKPSAIPETGEKTETTDSEKTVEKKNGKAEKENKEQVGTVVRNENVRSYPVIRGNGNVRNIVSVHKGIGTMTKSETPDTGDHSHLTIYSVLFFGAGVLMIGLIRRMRNEEE